MSEEERVKSDGYEEWDEEEDEEDEEEEEEEGAQAEESKRKLFDEEEELDGDAEGEGAHSVEYEEDGDGDELFEGTNSGQGDTGVYDVDPTEAGRRPGEWAGEDNEGGGRHPNRGTAAILGIQDPTQTAQTITVAERQQPSSGSQFVTMRLPPQFGFEQTPWDVAKAKRRRRADRQLSPKRREADTLSPNAIRWRFAGDTNGGILVDEATQQPKRETNTHLLRWSDGSYTLSVGGEQLDCQVTRDKSHIFEESDPNVKVLHGFVANRIVCRPFTHQMSAAAHHRAAALGAKQQQTGIAVAPRTRLTTASAASQSVRDIQRRLQDTRDRQSLRTFQKEASKSAGLSARYLESDGDEHQNL